MFVKDLTDYIDDYNVNDLSKVFIVIRNIETWEEETQEVVWIAHSNEKLDDASDWTLTLVVEKFLHEEDGALDANLEE